MEKTKLSDGSDILLNMDAINKFLLLEKEDEKMVLEKTKPEKTQEFPKTMMNKEVKKTFA